MRSFSKIPFFVLVLIGMISIQTTAITGSGVIIGLVAGETAQQHQSQNETGRTFYQSVPLLPVVFVEAEQNRYPDIEPDPKPQPKRTSSLITPAQIMQYLRVSERSETHHPALKLIFPFHTYL